MYTVVTVNWERLLGLQARSAPESIPMQGLPWQGETLRYGFSGHETFPFRYAWLPKGVAAVREDPKAFSQPDALVRLGVGKNMVASIRFWCESLGLIDVRRQGAELTPLGELLFGTATDLTAQEKDSHDLHLGADPFQIITRWRAKEIAAGVSDLDVLQVAHDRPNTELALLDDLHAKLYLADEQCLVGSANLTGSALGWSNRSNIEILIPARQIDAEVAFLLERLRAATPATTDIRSEVEAAAAALQSVVLDEAQDMTEENEARRFLITYQAHLRCGHETQSSSRARRRPRIDGQAAGNVVSGPPEPQFPAASSRKVSLVRNQEEICVATTLRCAG